MIMILIIMDVSFHGWAQLSTIPNTNAVFSYLLWRLLKILLLNCIPLLKIHSFPIPSSLQSAFITITYKLKLSTLWLLQMPEHRYHAYLPPGIMLSDFRQRKEKERNFCINPQFLVLDSMQWMKLMNLFMLLYYPPSFYFILFTCEPNSLWDLNSPTTKPRNLCTTMSQDWVELEEKTTGTVNIYGMMVGKCKSFWIFESFDHDIHSLVVECVCMYMCNNFF